MVSVAVGAILAQSAGWGCGSFRSGYLRASHWFVQPGGRNPLRFSSGLMTEAFRSALLASLYRERFPAEGELRARSLFVTGGGRHSGRASG